MKNSRMLFRRLEKIWKRHQRLETLTEVRRETAQLYRRPMGPPNNKSFGRRRVNSTRKSSPIGNPTFRRKTGYTKTRSLRRRLGPTSLYARDIHRRLTHLADQSADNRSKTNTNFCKTSRSNCPNGTRDLPLPSSLPSIIRHVSSSAARSILPIYSPSALCLPSSSPRPTSEMLPCCKPIWPSP